MIQKAFGNDTVSAGQIKVWQECFKDGRESVESDPYSGRPATSRTPENVEYLWAVVHKDQRLTMRELADDLGIPKTTVSSILRQDVGMKCVMAKFISQLLLPKQKEHHATIANGLIQITTNEPDFFKKVIPGCESWVYGCDLETKAQST